MTTTNDNFKVEVAVMCDRTKKVHKLPMTLEQAGQHTQNMANKTEMAKEITSFLGGLPPPKPDLVVMFRGQVVVLPTVLGGKEATLLRLLHDLTQSSAFPSPEPTSRKKTGKNGKRESASTVVSTTVE